jgi:hypothetical protein
VVYGSGYLSYKRIVSRGKNVGVREVQICVRKLAGYAGDCAIFECLLFSIVTRDEGFKVVLKIFFYEHPGSSENKNIKLEVCAVIAITFVFFARS